jgi:hypothetical protein
MAPTPVARFNEIAYPFVFLNDTAVNSSQYGKSTHIEAVIPIIRPPLKCSAVLKSHSWVDIQYVWPFTPGTSETNLGAFNFTTTAEPPQRL